MLIRELEESLERAKEDLRRKLNESSWVTQFSDDYKDKAVEIALKVVTERIPVDIKYDELFDQYMLVATNYMYLGEYKSDAEAKKALELFSY